MSPVSILSFRQTEEIEAKEANLRAAWQNLSHRIQKAACDGTNAAHRC